MMSPRPWKSAKGGDRKQDYMVWESIRSRTLLISQQIIQMTMVSNFILVNSQRVNLSELLATGQNYLTADAFSQNKTAKGLIAYFFR